MLETRETAAHHEHEGLCLSEDRPGKRSRRAGVARRRDGVLTVVIDARASRGVVATPLLWLSRRRAQEDHDHRLISVRADMDQEEVAATAR